MVLLPDDVHFYEDVRLLAWRPRGLLNEPTVNKVIGVLEDLEAKLKEPFNRFSDTSAIDRIELNYRYIIHISLYRVLSYGDQPPVKSAILTADSAIARYFQLHAIITEGFADQGSNISRTRRRREMARRAAQEVGPKFAAS